MRHKAVRAPHLPATSLHPAPAPPALRPRPCRTGIAGIPSGFLEPLRPSPPWSTGPCWSSCAAWPVLLTRLRPLRFCVPVVLTPQPPKPAPSSECGSGLGPGVGFCNCVCTSLSPHSGSSRKAFYFSVRTRTLTNTPLFDEAVGKLWGQADPEPIAHLLPVHTSLPEPETWVPDPTGWGPGSHSSNGGWRGHRREGLPHSRSLFIRTRDSPSGVRALCWVRKT